ncbi:hypothetical protein NDU88_006310 [Pleurodeles waltl]|uniref:Uncharacterized protein n=1 Tax=Pleurodeles waltl TaxID=8319 RepID=A0AAV7MH50_PLEWA|nr:hypothetical protein NDU88_006310 [Pleurodeles waltl]
MDFKITDLATESKSIGTDIAAFQDRVTEFDNRITNIKSRLYDMPDTHQELQLLRNKLMDLEGRSQKDNERSFGI